jgi:arabinose-5-phosphate isomerase
MDERAMNRPLPKVREENYPHSDSIVIARGIIASAAQVLHDLGSTIGLDFQRAVELILQCRGHIVVSGVGKAGLVGQKVSATLASTGTPSHFLHAGEAMHGDLGRVGATDLVLVFSYSGQTEEIRRMLPSVVGLSRGVIAVTGNPHSQLARQSQVALILPPLREAGSLGVAPTNSTTAMLALGDALALVVSQNRRFGSDDFARFHPGGSLGVRLGKVDDLMRPMHECRIALCKLSIRQVLVQVSKEGRRTGAIMLVDEQSRLCGIFTDSDLARLLEKRGEPLLDQPIEHVMSKRFHAIQGGARAQDAIELLAARKISELPVVDHKDVPLGLIDITDVLGLVQQARWQQEERGDDPAQGAKANPSAGSIRLFQG